MNIIEQLTKLSVDDLKRLQTAVLTEIRRRQEPSGTAMPPAEGPPSGGQRIDKGEHPTPPPAAKPARRRRTA